MTDAEPLTYRPRKNLPGTAAAAASAQRILDRVIEETGLRQPDITASSITRWRILTIYNHAGSKAATQAYGRKSPDRTLRAIGIGPDERTYSHDPARTSFLDY